MKKNWKKMIGLLTAAAVSVTAMPIMTASAEESTEGAMGRYIEEDVELPYDNIFEIMDLKVQTDGSVRMLANTSKETVLLRSEDNGITWTEDSSLPQEMKPSETGYLYKGALSPEGDIFGLYTNSSAEDGEMPEHTYYQCDAAGNVTEVTPEFLGEIDGLGEDFCNQLIYLESGKVLGQGLASSQIYLFDDKTGEVLQTYNENDNYTAIWGAAAGNLYAVTQDDLLVYDLETGEEKVDEVLKEAILEKSGSLNITTTSSYPLILTGGTEDDSVFYASEKGLFRHITEGAVLEQLADGALNSLGNPGYGLVKMQQASDGAFLFALYGDKGSKLVRMVYSADTPTVPNKELKVYTLRDNATLRQAIALFQKKNPDYYVNLEVGVTGEDAITESDALRTLNTNIMADKGPDVLVLDGMPIEAYTEKGILSDMSALLAETAEKEGFFENIVKAYEKDGALYAVPSRFRIPIMQASEEVLSQINSLTSFGDTVQQLKDADSETECVIDVNNIYVFLQKLYAMYSTEIIREDGSLNEENVREFVTQAKRIFDMNEIVKGEIAPEWNLDFYRNYEYSFDSISVEMSNFMMGTIQIGTGTIDNVMELMQTVSINDRLGYTLDNARLTEKNIFVPEMILGINSKSTRQEDAAALIQFLFSKEAQTQSGVGLAVNQAAFEENLEKESSALEDGESVVGFSFATADGEGDEGWNELIIRALNDSEEEQLRQMIASLDTPALTDSVMEGLIIEQTGNCLAGQISEEEAVQSIIQKMMLYLSE